MERLMEEKIHNRLIRIYGEQEAAAVLMQLQELMLEFKVRLGSVEKERGINSEKNVILITYADMVRRNSESNLETLNAFLTRYC